MKNSGLGIASFILGIVGILLSCIVVGVVPCIIGLILGIVAITKKNSGHGLAITGIVLSAVGILICIIIAAANSSSTDTKGDNSAKVGEVSGGSSVEESRDEGRTALETIEDTSATDVETSEADTNSKDEFQDNTEEFAVGDIIETSNLRITFLSAEPYTSDNMFIEPADGNEFYRLEFEFENIGSDDEYVSSFNFDGYADGYAVNQIYFDDTLSATLSSGKKVKGAVYFEIPADAEEFVAEYLDNMWTSKRYVFVVK